MKTLDSLPLPLPDLESITLEPVKQPRQNKSHRTTLHVCGLSHATADLHTRKHFSWSPERRGLILEHLREQCGVEQALVLSTCNRTEIYALGDESHFKPALLELFAAESLNPGHTPENLPLYHHQGLDAVRHLFAVNAGLDSMILGEKQIKQQIRQAFEDAQAAGFMGSDLQRVCEYAFRTGKRIRTETTLNEGTLCVGKAAVLRAEECLGDLAGKNCLVIGAGKIARTAARAISERHPARLLIVNRSLENAEELAAAVGGEAHPLESLNSLLMDIDLVVGGAFSHDLLLTREDFQRHAPNGERPARVCVTDVAVPCMIDRSIGELPGVEFHDIESLETIVEANRKHRDTAAREAWCVVDHELNAYRQALKVQARSERIKQLCEKVDRIFDEHWESIKHTVKPEQLAAARKSYRQLKLRLLHEKIRVIKNK